MAPLGLIGVVGALLLSGRPLGFVAILGILALLGMITKNAVILIGQIDSEREQGKDVMQAAIDASSARLRPIVLTAISTVLGMIPIAPDGVLGSDGRFDHGRAAGCDPAHSNIPAYRLCGLFGSDSKPQSETLDPEGKTGRGVSRLSGQSER